MIKLYNFDFFAEKKGGDFDIQFLLLRSVYSSMNHLRFCQRCVLRCVRNGLKVLLKFMQTKNILDHRTHYIANYCNSGFIQRDYRAEPEFWNAYDMFATKRVLGPLEINFFCLSILPLDLVRKKYVRR